MATDRIARIGWSTGLKIIDKDMNEYQLLANSGEIRDGREPVYVNTADVGDAPGKTNTGVDPARWWEDPSEYGASTPTNASRIKVIIADGNVKRELNVGFSCDNVTLPGLIDWIFTKRKEPFTLVVGLTDLRYVRIENCQWSQFSLSTAANSLVTGTLTAQTTSVDDLTELTWDGVTEFSDLSDRSLPPYTADFSTGLVPYWQTGNNDVISWNINVTQALTPLYLNNGSDGPMYFRVGAWDISVAYETLINPQDPQQTEAARQVRLCAQKLFKPITGMRLEKTTTKGGNEEPVRYSSTFGLHGEPSDYTDTATANETFTIE